MLAHSVDRQMEDDSCSFPPLANSENSNNVTNNVLPRNELCRFVVSPASNSSKNSRSSDSRSGLKKAESSSGNNKSLIVHPYRDSQMHIRQVFAQFACAFLKNPVDRPTR